MREGIGRKKHVAHPLATAAFRNTLREHARRKAGLHKFAVGDDAAVDNTISSCCAVCHRYRNRAMPIHRTGMLKSPVDRNPARPPRLEPQFFRSKRVPPK